ncbi:3596_t:CDS:1, partial [Scutellospora calospora]
RVTLIKNKTISLNLSPNTHESICKALSETGFQYTLTILTGIDELANSCLVWKSNNKELVANGSGCLSSRLSGCFITFCLQQSTDRVQVIEDGLILFLTDNTFHLIHQALISRNSLNIKPNEDTHIVLEWDKEKNNDYESNIISKKTGHESNDDNYIAHLIEIELLTNMNEDRISLNSHVNYIIEIHNVVLKHFSLMNKNSGFNLSICFIIEDSKFAHIKLQTKPLDYDDSKVLSNKLWHNLTLVNLPIIYSGPVSFNMHYAVWGGTPESKWPEEEERNSSISIINTHHNDNTTQDIFKNISGELCELYSKERKKGKDAASIFDIIEQFLSTKQQKPDDIIKWCLNNETNPIMLGILANCFYFGKWAMLDEIRAFDLYLKSIEA